MEKYTTDERRLQVVSTAKNNKDEQKPTNYVDIDTGDWVPGLCDPKYNWREQKQKTLKMATLYRVGGDNGRADRAVSCSTWLQYLATASGDERTLKAFNACHQRLCPICSSRKARLMRIRLTRILKQAKKDHEHTQLIFLTLTLRNCSGDDLRDTLTLLTRAWVKLIRRRPFVRAVGGWFRAIEITRNSKDGTYHPHIHAILMVTDDYFRRSKKLYLTNDDYARMWQESLQVDYTPHIGIQSTYAKGGRRTAKQEKAVKAELAAATEAAKYATKDVEWLDDRLPKVEAADVLRTYTDALHGKRMTALGGWLKDAANALELDLEEEGDLVHDEESGDGLTDETAEILEIYGWHHGVQEHVLKGKIRNPLYTGGESEDSEHDEGTGTADTGGQSLEGHGGIQVAAAREVSAGRGRETGARDSGDTGAAHEELGRDAADYREDG